MSIFELTAILNHYKIVNRVVDGHVLARAKEGCDWTDVTDWSRGQIARWLGIQKN